LKWSSTRNCWTYINTLSLSLSVCVVFVCVKWIYIILSVSLYQSVVFVCVKWIYIILSVSISLCCVCACKMDIYNTLSLTLLVYVLFVCIYLLLKVVLQNLLAFLLKQKSLVNHLWRAFQHTSSNLKSTYSTVTVSHLYACCCADFFHACEGCGRMLSRSLPTYAF